MLEAKRPTVLVADHYEDTRSMLRHWLEMQGYGVVEAANGLEAFELTCGNCPDLILMSEWMPVLDGVEAARRIRQRSKECVFPIIAMSTYPTKKAQAAALAAGCDSFIPQPVDLDLLRDLLGHLLPGAASRLPPENN